ncbi:MAG TPA: hypothetical protein VHX36_14830 [Candidatus Acidoferrales bacterium]|nr:hypothetical protein [Candidatus Acidoferrales bacterium]
MSNLQIPEGLVDILGAAGVACNSIAGNRGKDGRPPLIPLSTWSYQGLR